jgi:uncharacterized protein YlzI (FlbEa/FlbD family)
MCTEKEKMMKVVANWWSYNSPDGPVVVAKDRVWVAEQDGGTIKLTFLNGQTIRIVDTALETVAKDLDLHLNVGGSAAVKGSGQWINLALVDSVASSGDKITITLANGVSVILEVRLDQFLWTMRKTEAFRFGMPFNEKPPEGTIVG